VARKSLIVLNPKGEIMLSKSMAYAGAALLLVITVAGCEGTQPPNGNAVVHEPLSNGGTVDQELFRRLSVSVVPIGGIIPFYGDPQGLPDNWILCDGRDFGLNADPRLRALGTAAPNLVGRTIVGAASDSMLAKFAGADSYHLEQKVDCGKPQFEVVTDPVDLSHTHPFKATSTSAFGEYDESPDDHDRNTGDGWGGRSTKTGNGNIDGRVSGMTHNHDVSGTTSPALDKVITIKGKTVPVPITGATSPVDVPIVPSHLKFYWIMRIR
jgi:hypothetical protein